MFNPHPPPPFKAELYCITKAHISVGYIYEFVLRLCIVVDFHTHVEKGYTTYKKKSSRSSMRYKYCLNIF